VARTTSVVDAGAGFDAQDVPADLVAGPEAPPSGPVGVGSYGGVRNMVYYRWSDPIDIEVDVFANDGGEQFRHDLAAAKASPNPDRSVAAVRGRDAIVRRTYTTVGYGEESTITWLDPTGHLVQIRIMPKQAGAVPDPDAVIASVRELDETEFQAMVARADQTPVRHG
jgi:hypothetical protein